MNTVFKTRHANYFCTCTYISVRISCMQPAFLEGLNVTIEI